MISQLECENCGIMFQAQRDLANHKKKFCIGSKYGNVEELTKNFEQVSKNKDISLYGKMSLAMQGRGFDLSKAEQIKNNALDDQYRSLLKQIEEEKSIKNKAEADRQKAFRELEALEKQEEELVIDDKRVNLQEVIARRQALAREEDELQKQIREYQAKKKQWNKSEVKVKQQNDMPYEHGVMIGKIGFERNMLEQKKSDLQNQINAKKRQKQKLQKQLMKMSAVAEDLPVSKVSIGEMRNYKSNVIMKVPEQPQHFNIPKQTKNYDYSQLNNFNDNASQISKASSKKSSKLDPIILNGNEKILKFHLNKQGKSEEDKVIESIMAQQYDDLKILSKLPKGSDIYNIKLKQYTELSKQRMEVQEKAQKQRVEKMKRQFEFEKILVEKQRDNANWVDENRKIMMAKQIQILQKKSVPFNGDMQYNGLNSKNSESDRIPSANLFSQNKRSPNQYQNPYSQLSSHQKSALSKNQQFKLNTDPAIESYPYQQLNAQSKNKQKDSQFGYRISVLALRNYSLKKAIKIKLIIYEQYYHESEKGLKYEFSTIYHDESVSDKDPFNPSFKNKLDSTGAILYNESFYVPENMQKKYDSNQKQMYMLIIAAEKDQKKITNEPRPYCWYSFKITHFGQIREGRFTFNLYGDEIIFPFPADMNRMKKKQQEQITIELEEVLLEEHMLQYAKKSIPEVPQQSTNTLNNRSDHPSIQDQINRSSLANNSQPQLPQQVKQGNTETSSDKVSMNYPLKMKTIEEHEATKMEEEFFYSNEKTTEFSHVTLKKPLNFDVSLSGLRTLPSYVGPVKLEITFIDADGSYVLPKEEVLAEIGTDLYNPLINFTKKIRNQSRIPPSTIIFIRMIVISALDYQVYSLGFSLIYLFLDRDGEPIISNKITDYLMTSGYYQLPIFWGSIEPRYISVEQLLINFAPIPCSSILIGILENASKISNPMPAYTQKIYNTILFQIDDNEAKLFHQQYKREPIDTNTLISGYLQYKGIKKNYSGEQVQKYIFKTLTFSKQNTTKLELKWMAEYQEYFGITFVIDKLTVPASNSSYYYFLTVCSCPPANYYKNKKMDLNFCRKINLEKSKVNELTYSDNEFFVNPAYSKNASLIIQVNKIQIFDNTNTQSDNNIESAGYIILPLFEIQQKIRSSNAISATVKLYEGDLDINYIENVEKDLKGFLNKISKQKKSKSELSFRMLNGYFLNQYPPSEVNQKLAPLKSIVPENMSWEGMLENVNQILSNNYNQHFDN